ncbi:BolA family protein [Legionella sp. CNM-4043-24]|uniref:BolA family protein n=1 Tax=Legionella sp. CNM-4043-24 TaxID=3421646 RepID=UPI00403AB573
MISNEEIRQRLLDSGETEYVLVEGDGYHYQLIVVSEAFAGKSLVARQQWVYAKLKDYITTGGLHALSMKTWTHEEWEKKRG